MGCSSSSNAQRTPLQGPTVLTVQSGSLPGSPIPGLPGFRTCVDSRCHVNSIISFHSFHKNLYVQEFPIDNQRIVGIEGALELIKADFVKQFRSERDALGETELRFENAPAELWSPADLSSTSFAIYMLARGLFVACGPTFVAAFNIRLSCWFLNFVAVEPGRYLPLKLSAGLKFVAELNWSGSCVKATTIIRKNEQIPWNPVGAIAKLHFFTPKPMTSSPNEVKELFVSWFHRVYAKTSAGLYELVRTPGGWAFKEARVSSWQSDEYLPEMEVNPVSHQITIKPWELERMV